MPPVQGPGQGVPFKDMVRLRFVRNQALLIRAFALTLVASGAVSCALDAPSTGLTIRIPDLRESRVNASYLQPDRSFISPRLGGDQSWLSVPNPTDWRAFSCYGVMVSAPDINDGYICSNFQGGPGMPSRPGHFGGLVSASGGTVQMKVASGSNRLIQLIGVMAGSSGVCPDLEEIGRMNKLAEATGTPGVHVDLGDPIELARTTKDIFADTTVTLAPTYDPANPAVMFKCNSNGTGTGTGTGSGFDPNAVGGLSLWLSSDDLASFTDGNSLPSWNDRSSSALHPTTVAGTVRVAKSNAFTQGNLPLPNGRPVAHFDQASYMKGPANNPNLLSAGRTVIVVALPANSASHLAMYAENVSSCCMGGSNNFIGMKSNSTGGIDGWLYDSGGAPVMSTKYSALPGAWHVYSLVWRTSGGSRVELYVDNVLADTGPMNATPGALAGHNGVSIGADGSGSSFFLGDIAEVLVYNNEIGDNQRRTLECKLAAKYGTQLANYNANCQY